MPGPLGWRARRRWAGRLGLALGGLLLSLGAVEGGLRLWPPGGQTALVFGAPEGMPPEAYRGDPELFQEPVPGWSGAVRGLEYGVSLRFNALGLRGPELTEKRPRILLLGDSFALAAQVDEGATLAGRLAAETGAQVLNAGVDGYSTWQETLRYQRLAEATDPDTVVLLFFLGNDLADNERFAMLRGTQYQPRAGEGPGWWARHSALGAWARALSRGSGLSEAEKARYARELAVFTRDDGGVLEGQIPATQRALATLKQETEARGDQLVVALAPPAFVVVPERAGPTLALAGLDAKDIALDRPARTVRSLLRRLGISTCDLSPALAELGDEAYLIYDGHWSEMGNSAAARTVAACLDE